MRITFRLLNLDQNKYAETNETISLFRADDELSSNQPEREKKKEIRASNSGRRYKYYPSGDSQSYWQEGGYVVYLSSN